MSLSENAEKYLRIVEEAPIISVDTETSGVDWRKNFAIGYVVSEGKESVYVPVRHGGGGNLPGCRTPKTATDPIEIHPFEKDLAKTFSSRKGLIVGHNLKFDCHFFARAGVLLGRNLSCTQNRATLLNEYSHSYSLESCAAAYGVTAKKGEAMYQHLARTFGVPTNKKAMANFWELPGNDAVATEYAEGDGITTFQLWYAQQKEVNAQDLQTIDHLEGQLIWTLFRMEERGIRVDMKYLDQLTAMIDRKVEQALSELPDGFNVRSPLDVKKYLTDNGRTDWPTTEKNNPSLTESYLRLFPEGQRIIVVRKWSNLANTFVQPLIAEHTVNGRVHATFNQLKSDDYGTPARLSCSAPNLQQIPKRDKDIAMMFRKAFVADPGMEFNEGDYSQAEPRMYAHYSKEPALIDGYNKTPFEDVHTIVARMLNVDREIGKRMSMGIFTGMYPKTFSEHMGWPLDRATDAWNAWHSMFPLVRTFQDTAKNALLSRGYVKTILGRRLRLEHPRFAYRAVSKIIQGGQADILKQKMLDIDKLLESSGDKLACILASVHDSIVWQNRTTKTGRQLSKEIVRIMEDVQTPPFSLRIPFVVGHKAGKDWADATFDN